MKQNPIEAICSPIPLGKSELCLCVILTLDFHILGIGGGPAWGTDGGIKFPGSFGFLRSVGRVNYSSEHTWPLAVHCIVTSEHVVVTLACYYSQCLTDRTTQAKTPCRYLRRKASV